MGVYFNILSHKYLHFIMLLPDSTHLTYRKVINNVEYVHYGFGIFRESMYIMALEPLHKLAIAEILHS